jgi:hypothetical protein
VPAAPAASPAGDARPILQAFFAEPDAAKRAEIAARFAAVAPKSWDDLKALLHSTAALPGGSSTRQPLAPGRQKFETRGDADVPAVKYVLRVPDNYQADAPRGWPLIITCHGTGGNADGALASLESWLGPDAGKFLLAAAESPQPGVYEATRVTVEYPLRVLDDIRHRANVDSDRTILTGVSRGGYTAWGTVLFSPGEWAGAVPIASFPLTEARVEGATLYLPNVLNLWVQAHWGATDIEAGQKEGIATISRDVAAEMKRLGAKKFEGIEYPGEGHDVRVKADRFREFAATALPGGSSTRRDPWPLECRLIFHRLYEGRDYYVRAIATARDEFDFRAKRVLTITRKEDLARAKRALYLNEGYELTGRMVPAQNLVAVLARNIREVEVELSAERLDFTRPVRITANSRSVQEGMRKVDWVELLETARRTYDFERLVAGRVRVTVAGAGAPPAAKTK